MTTTGNSAPFAHGKGLIGGYGDKREAHRKLPPLVHRFVLRPYEVPEHVDEARALYATPKVEVEIGFGRSHFLRDRIADAPDRRFLGFEVKRVWVTRVARFCERNGFENTRVVLGDARPLLSRLLPAGTVQAFYVFFPDPWWKKKHHKRRVMSAEVLEVMTSLLAPDGAIEVRTDVQAYFELVQGLFEQHGGYELVPPGVDETGRPLPLTHREKKCAEAGIPVYRLRARLRQPG